MIPGEEFPRAFVALDGSFTVENLMLDQCNFSTPFLAAFVTHKRFLARLIFNFFETFRSKMLVIHVAIQIRMCVTCERVEFTFQARLRLVSYPVLLVFDLGWADFPAMLTHEGFFGRMNKLHVLVAIALLEGFTAEFTDVG